MSKLLFIFLDGVGIGKKNPDNPFFLAKSEYLPFYKGGILPDKTPIKPIDATLGVSGLPQSASGQTSLFTGINIPSILKKHTGSFPNQLMRKYIYQHNLLKKIKEKRPNSFFINAYPYHTEYFTSSHIKINPDGELVFSKSIPNHLKRSISVSSCMLLSSNESPFNKEDLVNKKALYQDYSNRHLIKLGIDIEEFSPIDAADILVNAINKNDFILFEYFLTDIFAHRKNLKDKIKLIKDLNMLLGYIIKNINPKQTTLLLTSDHGNLEDHTSTQHTKNPVPLLLWGKNSDTLRNNINSILDITPGILKEFI